MTAIISGRGKIKRLATELKYYQLNFENVIIHSRLREFEKEVPDSGLSIKMGVKGKEHYIINKERLSVSPTHYLIVNRHQQFECQLKSHEIVEGFCFYLSNEVLYDAYRQLYETTADHLEDPTRNPINIPDFMERVYHLKENRLGQFLHYLRPKLLDEKVAATLDYDDIFFQLAKRLLTTQLNIKQQIDQISSARLSTREELYRRLCMANHYIHDNFTRDIQLEKLAKVAMLSKFHLLRTYKQIYGVTPYKQVLQLRLTKAKELMKNDYGLEEIAFMLGFSDRRSFTKAFKKSFHVPPSDFRLRLQAES